MNDDADDDLCGLLCVPPGMSAAQVKEFNRNFEAMTRDEQRTVLGNMAKNLTKKGQPIVEAIQNSITEESNPAYGGSQ